jgi:putative ABC transport system permease protein
VAIAIMVGSFRDTVDYWLDSTLHADVLARPITLKSLMGDAVIRPEAVAAMRRDPDVESVTWVRVQQAAYESTTIRLAAAPLSVALDHGVVLFKSPRDARTAARRAIGADEALVSESFSLRFGKLPGDMVNMPTPHGPRSFRVAAVYYDYANNQGTVMVDAETYRRRFSVDGQPPLPSTLGMHLRPGADPDVVRARLARTVPGAEALYLVTNANVRREAMRIFDSTFTITYALQSIAIVIAALGVVSTLLTLIYERRQEIALVSLTGATPGQVRRMVMLEALLLGSVGQAIAVLVGLVLAAVLIYVINVQSFGWTIQFHLPLRFLVQSTLLILAATTLCGLYPAIRAANVDALQTVRDE